jgi:hypothetical protein
MVIPTFYNKIWFRSRLEAEWMEFFDLVGCEQDYEPTDLPGYTPDFYLHGKKEFVFVEVKPYLTE